MFDITKRKKYYRTEFKLKDSIYNGLGRYFGLEKMFQKEVVVR